MLRNTVCEPGQQACVLILDVTFDKKDFTASDDFH